jgi:drug/metabolite transporter (DMT)-like permease
MRTRDHGYIYAAMAVLLWATVASAFKIALRHLDFLQLVFYASAVSMAFFFAVLLVQGRLGVLKTYSKGDYLRSMVLGFLNPFLYYVVLFQAYSLLPAQEAQTLNYTWPIMIALLSIPVLKQQIGIKSVFAIVLSFSGVFITATEGDIFRLRFTNLNGVLLALSSAVIWALFWIYHLKNKRDDVARLCLNFAFGFVYTWISLMFFSTPIVPDINGLLAAAYVGLFEMGLTFLLWLRALSLSTTTAQASHFVYVVPFLSLIIIHLIVGERILVSTIIGLLLVVLGILLQRSARASS